MAKPSPEAAAADLLSTQWAFHDGSIELPVDPIRIARDLGLRVLVAPMQPDVSGTLVRRPGEPPAIYLNRDDSSTRQRFTCAHELGHYLDRTSADQLNFEFVDFRSDLATRGSDPDEIYANQFAAALLMPPDRLAELLTTRPPSALARLFGVSAQAMHLRLHNLRLV